MIRPQNDLIAKYAHDYQKKAINFGYQRKQVFYALDLGMGKTLIALALVQYTGQKAIVFAPLKPIYNTWPDEIAKWTPHLTYDIIHGTNKYNTLRDSKADILLVNYDTLKFYFEYYRDMKHFCKRMLILDESSMIKNPSTVRFKTFKKMDALWTEYKMCLSATPAPNGYHNLWTQYFILDKGEKLGKVYGHFRNQYFNYSGPPLYRMSLKSGSDKTITNAVKPITFRLEARDYLQMPGVINNNIAITMPKEVAEQYKLLVDQFYLEFSEQDISSAMSAAALSMKLRQFIQGGMYLDEGAGAYQEIHTLKVDWLKEMLETAAGNPILCPIQFKFDLAMIHKHIDKDIPCIAGGTSNALANKLIKQWNAGELPLLLCHPASIGHGTNLQSGGHTLLWYAQTWSLELLKQLNGRLIRQGQESKTVVVNYLTLKNTIDDRITQVISQKNITQEQFLAALKRILTLST